METIIKGPSTQEGLGSVSRVNFEGYLNTKASHVVVDELLNCLIEN